MRQRTVFPYLPRRPRPAHVFCLAIFGAALLCSTAACSPTSSVSRSGEPTPTPTLLSPTATPRPAVTYAAIGASDSFGTGTADPAHDNWPAVLSRQLGDSVHLLNLGIPGATTELAQRDEVPIAVAAQPNIVTVLLGVNDLDDGVPLSTFRYQLASLVAVLESETTAQVFVANLPDLTLFPHFAHRNPAALTQELVQWNAAIAQVAREVGAVLVDLYTDRSELVQHPDYIASDGLHPSTLGAVRVARVFAEAIEAAKTP